MAVANNHHKLQALQTYTLCVRCGRCCKKHNQISYSINNINHSCSENIVLIRRKHDASYWRPVAPLPNFPRPKKYVACWYYAKDRGCTRHGNNCQFASSSEEAALWNVMKDEKLTIAQIVNAIKQNQRTPQATFQEKRGPNDCTLCQDHFPTDEDFMNHCFTVKHRRRIFEDSNETWKHREPPPTHKGLNLCERYVWET